MANFNNQFATQKLREENNTFYVKYNKGYGKGEGIAKEFNSKKEAEEYAKRMNDISSGMPFPMQSHYYVVDPNEKPVKETSMTGTGAGMTLSTVNNPTNQDWYTTKNKKKVKKEVKDVEPKLAAGKAKVYMKDKWGWKEAPSIPNRPSKGGFMYSQIFEDTLEERSINENLEPGDRVKVIYGNEFYGETGTIDDIIRGFVTVEMDSDGRIYSMHSSDVEKIDDEEDDYDYNQIDEANSSTTNSEELARVEALLAKARETKDYSVMTAYENRIKLLELIVYLEKKLGKQFPVIGFGENFGDYIRDKFGYEGNIDTNKIGAITNIKDIALAILSKKDSLQESYSKFKTETKTRGKSDQFHQAVREVRRKVQEINRLFEYVSRLKLELSEGEGGLKYKVHTEKALAKIKEMVSELNQNIKKFK